MKRDCVPPGVRLRPWLESDAEALFELAGDPVIGQTAGFPPHRDVEDSRRVIREILSKPGAYAVVSAEDGGVVGCVSALPYRAAGAEGDVREIGYWVGRRFWNRGFATAAVIAMCKICFAQEGICCRVVLGRVREENAGSRRVLEKCGFAFDGKADGYCRYVLRQ